MIENELARLTADFSAQIVRLVESSVEARIREALSAAFSGAKRGPGRPRKVPLLAGPVALSLPSARKSRPKQLCPVPGCKNPAAPVFGMVCAEHKNVSKAKIKQYRAARKAAKAGKKAPKRAAGARGKLTSKRKTKVAAKIGRKATRAKAPKAPRGGKSGQSSAPVQVTPEANAS